VRAAAGTEAATAREWSGRGEDAASKRGQTLMCLAVDVKNRRGGDPGTLGYVGATWRSPREARVGRREHESVERMFWSGREGLHLQL
jgi:hypothetical protein